MEEFISLWTQPPAVHVLRREVPLPPLGRRTILLLIHCNDTSFFFYAFHFFSFSIILPFVSAILLHFHFSQYFSLFPSLYHCIFPLLFTLLSPLQLSFPLTSSFSFSWILPIPLLLYVIPSVFSKSLRFSYFFLIHIFFFCFLQQSPHP